MSRSSPAAMPVSLLLLSPAVALAKPLVLEAVASRFMKAWAERVPAASTSMSAATRPLSTWARPDSAVLFPSTLLAEAPVSTCTPAIRLRPASTSSLLMSMAVATSLAPAVAVAAPTTLVAVALIVPMSRPLIVAVPLMSIRAVSTAGLTLSGFSLTKPLDRSTPAVAVEVPATLVAVAELVKPT